MRAETRRQLKQDKFSRATIQVAEQTVHWSVEHKGKIFAGSIVLIVVISAALGSWYYLEKQDEKASADFTKAVQTMNTPVRPAGMPPQLNEPTFGSGTERATEAHKQFQAIVNKYPHTRSADFAHYFLGVTSASVGDNVAAERELTGHEGQSGSADQTATIVIDLIGHRSLPRFGVAEKRWRWVHEPEHPRVPQSDANRGQNGC